LPRPAPFYTKTSEFGEDGLLILPGGELEDGVGVDIGFRGAVGEGFTEVEVAEAARGRVQEETHVRGAALEATGQEEDGGWGRGASYDCVRRKTQDGVATRGARR
jgi:hypothetical protein